MNLQEYLIEKIGLEEYQKLETILFDIYKKGEKNGMQSMCLDLNYFTNEILTKRCL